MTTGTTPQREQPRDPFRNAGKPMIDLGHLYRESKHAQMPSAGEHVARMRTMREEQRISIREAARRAAVEETTVSKFESTGEASSQVLLDLIKALSHSASFHDAFKLPRFTDLSEVREHARRTKP